MIISRNVIWVGDTIIDSGRIFEFSLNSDKFTEHKINGTSIVTVMALDLIIKFGMLIL